MSHFWPKRELPTLTTHHFGVRIFTFGWRSSFLGISVMQTTRLMQDFPDQNLLQEKCRRTQKKIGTKYENANPEMKSASLFPPQVAGFSPDSLEKQAPLAILHSKKHMLPALRFSSCPSKGTACRLKTAKNNFFDQSCF